MNVVNELSTRDRLKLSARQLFAQKGVSGVTVRDILAHAGDRNGASLNYYFTSKEVLIREIVIDIFTMMETRWSERLAALEADNPEPDLRDYVRLLVQSADTSDVEEFPTTARLSEILTLNYYDMVAATLKENKLQCYDVILSRIARHMTQFPDHVVRQRLVLLTKYLSSIFALYEGARVGGSERQRATLGIEDYGHGDVVDTAVGLLTASAHSAELDEHVAPLPGARTAAGTVHPIAAGDA